MSRVGTGGYTWENVMFGIDVRTEAEAEAEEMQRIQDMQRREGEAASAGGFWGTLVGWLVAGPVGGLVGSTIGKFGADVGWWGGDYSDWEDQLVDLGKFDKEEVRKFNESIAQASQDQTAAQWLDFATSAASMYVMSGGLSEGDWDPTTFGSGDAEWSVLGKGTAPKGGDIIAGADPALGPSITPATTGSADYVESLWDHSRGFVENLAQVGSSLSKIYAQERGINYLFEQFKAETALREEEEPEDTDTEIAELEEGTYLYGG